MADQTLRVIQGNAAGSQLEVDDELVVGRGATDVGRLGDDPELSRQHARLSRGPGGELTIEDLGSTNGTFVNGERLGGRRRLLPGDQVRVGQTIIQVGDASGPALQATAFSTIPGGSAATRMPGGAHTIRDGTRTASTRGAGADPTPTGRRWASPARLGAIAATVIVLVGAGLAFALTSGGDEPEPTPPTTSAARGDAEPATLTTQDIVERGEAATVKIDTAGPQFDWDTEDIVRVRSGGTGIVIDAREGLILTNAHVVAGQTSISVQLHDETVTSARVEGQAPCEDLAVIRLRPVPPGLQAAELGSSQDLRVGEPITALGFPGAFEERITDREFQATQGTVSSGTTEAFGGPDFPLLPAVVQHQAPINAGNSGGPLFDGEGRVVGVNTFSGAQEGSQNQNGAIAIDRVKALLADLRQGRDTGYVGWDLAALPDELGGPGLFMLSVASGSPAAEEKFRPGDVVYALDGTPVQTLPDVCEILGSKGSGDQLAVTWAPFGAPKRPRLDRTIELDGPA